jgi:hypothetical protein
MQKILLMLFIALTLISSIHAQNIDDIVPDFSPEEQDFIAKSFGTFTNATTVFTGRNNAASGTLQYKEGDAELNIYNLPITYMTGEKDDSVRYVIRGAIGHLETEKTESTFSDIYSDIENTLPLELQGLPNFADKQEDRATSITLGTGLIYKPTKNLTIEPAFDLIWTQIKREFEYGNFVSALLGAKYDRDLFNHKIEAITYAPSLDINYVIPVNSIEFIPSAIYTHLWTEETSSDSRFANFSIDSGVLQTQMMLNIPVGKTLFNSESFFRPAVKYTKLYSAVADSLGENHFYDYGATMAFNVNNSYFKEITVGGAYYDADSFDGYRIDLGFELH